MVYISQYPHPYIASSNMNTDFGQWPALANAAAAAAAVKSL